MCHPAGERLGYLVGEFLNGAEEFSLFLALYDALVARFGVAADEKFAAVLNGITKARRQSKRQQYNAARAPADEAQRRARSVYNAAYRVRPRTEEELTAERLARAAYMRDYRARPRTGEQMQVERHGGRST